MLKKIVLGASIVLSSSVVSADAFMSPSWAKAACDAWNANATLTGELGGDAWAANDNGRGYKAIQMYRTDCGEAGKVQLNIENKDGKAMCTYGGVPDGKEISKSYDYIMHATDERWTQMGNGDYGPMKAMMFGRLKFSGPKTEAMSVMGPFGAFLKLAGGVPGDKGKDNCPTAPTEQAAPAATPPPAEQAAPAAPAK